MKAIGIKRARLTVNGQVQGVGFRPFVWRLATQLNLSGFVRNTSDGVVIEIQGQEADASDFTRRLARELPPLARITAMKLDWLETLSDETGFSIGKSESHGGQKTLVSPDVGICRDCLADIRRSSDRRYGYAFTNCTNCGPRYTITRELPYDRATTVMACFGLCENCAREYADPANRRFHAQPVACPDCGPALWFVDKNSSDSDKTGMSPDRSENALAKAGAVLLHGGILALKGLGGFQLACDARDTEAVARLRRRKHRPHKALALMTRDMDSLLSFANPTSAERELLTGSAKPIVLCEPACMPERPVSSVVAPDTMRIGVMLPSTPLHALLLDWLADNGMPAPVLVMTSANASGEPICLGNREALGRLGNLADAWLLHDRDILVRVDDSVARVVQTQACPSEEETEKASRTSFFRRARGYVPIPTPLSQPSDAPCVLGTGAELKATFCLTRGHEAFCSQHIGDLENPATESFYMEALAHMQRLLEVKPQAIVHDLHPDFISTRVGRSLAASDNLPVFSVQHHVAHAVSALAENGCHGPALGICLDGAGLGTDGTVWGGELLMVDVDAAEWRRLGSLRPFALPGGDLAVREPWRIACSLGWQAGGDVLTGVPEMAWNAIREMLARSLNCPLTSSCGRLFDAMAALLGICDRITYNGQAAIRLEKIALQWLKKNSRTNIPVLEMPVIKSGQLMQLDSVAIFESARDMAKRGVEAGAIAAGFHFAIVENFARMARTAASQLNIGQVALSGGVMDNSIMAEALPTRLAQLDLRPVIHKQLPAGDGGISLGQAVWGQQLLKKLHS